jgi:two-component system, NtrC family, response regulator HydG
LLIFLKTIRYPWVYASSSLTRVVQGGKVKNKFSILYMGTGEKLASIRAGFDPLTYEFHDLNNSLVAGNILRPREYALGLVDIDDTSAEQLKFYSEQIEKCQLSGISCHWVGLVRSGDLNEPHLRRWLRSECADFWLHPCVRLQEQLRFYLQNSESTDSAGASQACFAEIMGSSPGMQHMRQLIARFSKVRPPVLIIGETGSGKELVARNIHDASERSKGRFLALNCGAMAPQLVQSELFGHEKGSFTGANQRKIGVIEAANGGTLLLDEIGDLPLDAQVNFLRFLQEGKIMRVGGTEEIKVDIRIIAATHVNLDEAVERGKFRADLLYRLNVLRIDVPPLRERGSDVLILAHSILCNLRKSDNLKTRGFDPEATRAMLSHTWPGNVRELSNRIHRAAVMCDRALIAPYELGLECVANVAGNLDDSRDRAEALAIEQALFSQGYNFSKAAKLLEISRVTLYRLASKHASRLSALAMREMPSAMPQPSNFGPLDGLDTLQWTASKSG